MFSPESVSTPLVLTTFDRMCSFVRFESEYKIPFPERPYPESAISLDITLSAACAAVNASVRLLSRVLVASDREKSVITSPNARSIIVIATNNSAIENPFTVLLCLRILIPLVGAYASENSSGRKSSHKTRVRVPVHRVNALRDHSDGDLFHCGCGVYLNSCCKRIIVDDGVD